ncbi:lipopolysaccharide biosynthesis protein [Actinopolymorpha sp. NPDC004070]|uniref:lipopolysaccharide biosynthesis protein n=1 Tax=Actinopolymorpha sp. NPDC004070 TaxID=3154548 RepID=UPI0033BE5DD7
MANSERHAYSVKRQFVWASIGRIAAALIQAVTVVVLARHAAPKEFGIFAAAYGAVIVAQALIDMGLSTLTIKERSRSRNSPIVWNALRLNGRITLIAVLSGVTLCIVLAISTGTPSLIFIPYVIWAVAERNGDAWLTISFADGDANINMTNLILRRLMTLAGLMLLIAFGTAPVVAFGLAAATASVCSLVFARLYIRRRILPTAAVPTRAILRLSFPFWFNSVAGQLRNLDALIVGAVAGTTHAGLYGAGARITGPLRLLPDALAAALLPAASRDSFRVSPKLIRQMALFALLATVIGLGGVMIAPLVVHHLLGTAYAGAELVIQLAIVGLPFASLVALLAAILQGIGKQSFVAGIAFAATVTCLCAVAIGALLGAAVGAMIGYCVSTVLHAAVLSVKVNAVARDAREPVAGHHSSTARRGSAS